MNLNQQLGYLFNPRSIAVIGATGVVGKWGFSIFKQVLDRSSGRKIYPVNKEEQEVLGVQSYHSISEVPEPVDLAVIVTPRRVIPEIIQTCVDRGVKFAIVVSAGFAESGEGGAELEHEIVSIAVKGGMRILGPNCMGHFDTASEVYTCPFLPIVNKGGIAVISHSGNIGACIVHYGVETGLGFSKLVSTGNEADLHLEDFLEYLARDEETRVITAYVEGLRESRRFLTLAKETTKKKPIVMVKGGRTATGVKAARSHTSALAGAEEVYNAAFKQAGVIQVEDLVELLDVAGALLRLPLPRGRRVGILSGGGGFGVLGADACEKLNLEVVPLSPPLYDKLDALLPSYWSRGNPVDTAGAAVVNPLLVYPCLEAIIEDESIDAVLALACIGLGTLWPQEEKGQEEKEVSCLSSLFELMDRLRKPLITSMVVSEARRKSMIFTTMAQQYGVQVYPTPQRAVRVLAHLVEYSEYLRGGKAGATSPHHP